MVSEIEKKTYEDSFLRVSYTKFLEYAETEKEKDKTKAKMSDYNRQEEDNSEMS